MDPKAPQLGTRGRRLWKQCTDDGAALKPAERVLLEEACRTADRLDTLDRILRGDEDAWMRFRSLNDDGSIVSVVVNNVLSEARQQQVALKALLAELRTSRSTAAGRAGGRGRPAAPSSGKRGGAGVTDIADRIAARRRNAAG
ncbi:hypothetical protein [Micromonospora chokoriensis]|uniref:hypothetical protein n=1 Tax=Micromonospora chokoriensis TaxID=356851 RepID=UPI00068E5E08|nr:hypothetical protein [Micromonospora chokoriensis]